MTCCQGSIRVGQTSTPIDVLISSGAATSYMSNTTAARLRLPVTINEAPFLNLEGVDGRQVTATHTATVDLTLGTFQQSREIEVLPSTVTCLVLGMDWLQDINPDIDYWERTVTIASGGGSRHTVQMKERDSDGEAFLPTVRVANQG